MARSLYVAADGRVLGEQYSPYSRVFVAPENVHLGAWLFSGDHGQGIAISDEGVSMLREEITPEEDGFQHLGEKGVRFIRCAISFREFLKVWQFESNYKKQVMTLGDDLWPGQELAVQTMEEFARVFFLKARRLGETTLAVAFDAWVLIFTPSCRVHLVSRIEKDAKDSLLKPLKFGLRRLPVEMQLLVGADTTTMLELVGGSDDHRVVEAFAAKEPGRGYGATHVHLDEWAAMMETSPNLPEDVWKAIAPTLNPDSTLHVLTTGKGPGFYAEKWEEAVKGEGEPDAEGIPTLRACFIKATGSRPDYTPERIKRERAESGTWEYPERWEEAIAGREGNYFTSYEIDWAKKYARGYLPPIYVRGRENRVVKILPHGKYKDVRGAEHVRRFVKTWDIGGPGEKSNASCGILLDVTEPVWDVRKIVYLQGYDYPQQARFIEQLHLDYPGDTWIEDNFAGESVRQFLMLPPDRVHGWQTTKQSKGVAIHAIKTALQYRQLKWHPDMEHANVLEAEMRKYQLKDEGIQHDTVSALWIAVAVAPEAAASTAGRVIRLFDGGLTM